MSYELKDYLNSINHTKENLLDSDDEMWEKKYPAYIVNHFLGSFPDTVLFVNEMNFNCHLDAKLQNDFLINIIRSKKRFALWLKANKLKDLEYVKEYYGYSDVKAKSALEILSDEQINTIKNRLNKGGRK
tara:strand:+ start:1695 stop:2084 length:390 start_codon:yes stop_codon:yes gene_type:complete